jgi:hypothetical protein
LYTKIVRHIRYDNPQGLWAVALETGISRVDELLEYCKQLRSHKDLYKFLGLTSAYAREYYIRPLVEQGRLKILTPQKTNRTNRFYLNAEVDMPSNIDDAIIFYCRSPSHLRAVTKHFGLTIEQFTEIAMPLIANGRLLGKVDNLTAKERVGISYKARYFISEFAMQKKGNAILEFCQEPHTRAEIEEFLDSTSKYYIQYLQPMIDSGKLLLTKPDQLKSVDQRYVAAGCMIPEIKVISVAMVQEYCRIPRTRIEITKYFEVKNYIAERFIEKMLSKGLLRVTNELHPRAITNRYAHPETEITVLSEDSLKEFCTTPRSISEIIKHFGVCSKESMSQYLQPLIRAGKLWATRPQGSHDLKVYEHTDRVALDTAGRTLFDDSPTGRPI